MRQIYVCNDSLVGLFSALYDGWQDIVIRGVAEWGIRMIGQMEQELFCEYREVVEEERKYFAVERLILKNMGITAYQDIVQAAMSEDPLRGDAILGTMLAAREIKNSKKIMEHLSNTNVQKVTALSRRVGDEAGRWLQFLRFRELDSGILYAEIQPKSQVLLSVAAHFEERLSVENWMIYDETHSEYAVHESGKRCVMVAAERISRTQLGRDSNTEAMYQELWKKFTKTISIKERENPSCQRNHMPIWMRKNMVETQ